MRCIRQKYSRTLALLVIFFLGVASITALGKVSASVSDGFEKQLSSFGANIIISPQKETLTVSYGGIPLGDMRMDEGRLPWPETLHSIKSIALKDRIAIVAPKLVGLLRPDSQAGNAAAPSGNATGANAGNSAAENSKHPAVQPEPGAASAAKPIPLVGVDFAQEIDLKQFWMVDGQFPEEGAQNQVLAGHALALRLGVKPGAALRLGGETLSIAGVLHSTGSDDDNVLFASLPMAQRLLKADGRVDFVEVAALCSGCPIDDIVAELRLALPGQEVRALRQVVAQRMYSIHFAQNLALLVAGVILASACAMLTMSMLSAVSERRKEIGILRAVGYSRSGVFVIFAAEACAIGLVAGLAGYLAGLQGGRQVLAGLKISTALPQWSIHEFLLCGLCSMLLAIAAAALPAFKAGRIDPSEALSSL